MVSTHFSGTVIALDDWPLVSKSLLKSDVVFRVYTLLTKKRSVVEIERSIG